MKWLGLISLGWLVASLVVMHVRWPFDRDKTLSQNAARSNSSVLYYGFILAAFLSLFGAFMLRWFIPSLDLSNLFVVVFTIGWLGQWVAAFVPEVGGVKSRVHIWASAAMSFSCYSLLILLLVAHDRGTIAFLATLISIAVMSACLLTLLVYKKILANALYLQAAYLTAFFVAIIVTAYA